MDQNVHNFAKVRKQAQINKKNACSQYRVHMFCVLMASFSPISTKKNFLLHFLQNSGRVPAVCLKLAHCMSGVN